MPNNRLLGILGNSKKREDLKEDWTLYLSRQVLAKDYDRSSLVELYIIAA